MIARAFAVAAVSIGLLASCGDDDEPTGPRDEVFTAVLNGLNERPNPNTRGSTGNATITINSTRTQVAFNITTVGLDSVISGHIHASAPVDSTAGVVVPLLSFPAPGVAQATYTGTVPLASINAPAVLGTVAPLDSLVKLIRAGRAYVNLHSVNLPGGEIRGQLRQ